MPRFNRMLLVDDDARDVELTLEALEESNLANEVDVARDGKEALDYLYYRGRFADRTRETPAVVLLDLKMPKVSGIDVLRQIKTDERLKMIPVVVLSSSAEERDVIESYKLGVNAYVVKPVDFGDFMSAVRQLGGFWALVNEAPPASVGS